MGGIAQAAGSLRQPYDNLYDNRRLFEQDAIEALLTRALSGQPPN